MKFRKTLTNKSGVTVFIPSRLTEAVDLTLCQWNDGQEYHKLKCLKRECDQCGVEKFPFLPEEISDEVEEHVIWKRYEYVGTKSN